MSGSSILILIIGGPIAVVVLFWLLWKIGWMRDDLPPGEKDVLQRFGPPVLLAGLAIGLVIIGGIAALLAGVVGVIVLSFLGAIFFALIEAWQRSGEVYKARLSAKRHGLPEPDAPPPLAPFHRRVARLFVKGLKELPFYLNPFSAAFH